MKNVIALILLVSCTTICVAQDTIHFNKGLYVNAPNRYGREAIYTDLLAFQLFNGGLQKPAEGVVFSDTMKWQVANADNQNRFRLRGGFGGGSQSYLYLTYNSPKERTALLNVQGNSGLFFNGEPHTGDPYRSGWLYIPVKLKKGLNEIYIRGGFVTADLIFPDKPVMINTQDPTLPFIVAGHENNALMGAVTVINTTSKELKGLQFKSMIGGKETMSDLPVIPALGIRKVIFKFDGSGVTETKPTDCALTLLEKGKTLDEKIIPIESVSASAKYSKTFISEIDGSLQYYAVTPQTPSTKEGAALFLSVHGAGVEAIGQARAYQHKDWGTLVAATNRRPRGFNWEDWGRLDALEVLDIAKKSFKPDPQRIYLTGHSMGGHGTWFLGATYPDKWAAIAPCAGYPTLKGYGSADGLIPDSSRSPMEQMLLRSSNQSDVLQLVNNYKPLGVYIFHGDADRTVPVRYARQMRKALGDFHPDLSYYEYPGGEHWFGDISVDWKPLFEFFKWHSMLPDSSVDHIDFTTASPGISSSYRWAEIYQQTEPLVYSRIQLNRNKRSKSITGSTNNVRLLKLDLNQFGRDRVSIRLDNQDAITVNAGSGPVFLLKQNEKWSVSNAPAASAKGPQRYGTFKEPFNNRMIFVYGTKGNKAENEWSYNKARFDAETWYYRGNGAVDVIADKDYSLQAYAGRGVIIYGNANTNTAWDQLLEDCPIRVERNLVKAGTNSWQGDDLGAYFCWPLKGSNTASVGVVTGSGLKGMNAAHANQYFAGASGFADFMIFRLGMLQTGANGVMLAGFFDNDWTLNIDFMSAHVNTK